MPLPASITTNLFPDFKNSFIGPFAKITQEVQDTDNATSISIGTPTLPKAAQSFQVSTSGEMVSVDLFLSKTGSPTDSLSVGLYNDSGGNPGTLLASGFSIAPSRVGAVAKYVKTVFIQPHTLATSTTYWIVVEKLGSGDISNNYTWRTNSTQPYANGQAKTFNSTLQIWNADVSDARFKFNIRVSGRYQAAVDKTNNKVRMYKSTDNGETWAEQDAANAPATATTANLKSISTAQQDAWISVMRVTDANGFAIRRFDTITDTWEALFTSNTSMPVSTSVSGAAPMLIGYKPLEANWDYTAVCNGQNETVMGVARRRIKFKRRGSGTTWPGTPGYDLVGSPNTPDLTTLPGTAVDHDLRAALVDGNGVWHGFWTQTDDSNIHHRQFNESNAFSTANLMGSTAAVTSNSAAYPIGQPTNYYRSGEWYIALPYVDSGVLKVSRVKAADAATAANWTNTSVVTAAIETANSNPAALSADNEQGGKLILKYTKTDGKLYWTHDQGNDLWVAEQELHPGTKTVGAISSGIMLDSDGIVYLDTAPATDDLKFDSL